MRFIRNFLWNFIFLYIGILAFESLFSLVFSFQNTGDHKLVIASIMGFLLAVNKVSKG